MFIKFSLPDISFLVGKDEARFILNKPTGAHFPKSFIKAMDEDNLVDCKKLASYSPDHSDSASSIAESEMLFGDHDFYLCDTDDSSNYSSKQAVRLGNVYIIFQQSEAKEFRAEVYILDYEAKKDTKILNIRVANICALWDMLPINNPHRLRLKGEAKTDPYIQKAANCIRAALHGATVNPDYAKTLVDKFSSAFNIHSRSAIGICSKILRSEFSIAKPATTTFAKEAGVAVTEDMLAKIYEDLKLRLKLNIHIIQNMAQELTEDQLSNLLEKIEIIITDMINCLSPETANKIFAEELRELNVFGEGFVANPSYEALSKKLSSAIAFVKSLTGESAVVEPAVSAGAGH